MVIAKDKVKVKTTDNLLLLIKHYSISLRQLSKAIGVTDSYLSKLTRKQCTNPSIDVIKKIADFFNISIAQLVGEQKIDFEKLPKKVNTSLEQ